jgi:phasin family protein
MAKTKTTTNGAEPIETALHTGAEAMKDGFEKAAKNYDQFMSFGRETAEAYMKSANAAGKAIESLNAELFAYARKSVEDGMAATKAIMSSKSIDEAIQLQSEFGRTAFEAYVDELAKVGDLALATAKVTAEPLQERVSALVDIVSGSRMPA